MGSEDSKFLATISFNLYKTAKITSDFIQLKNTETQKFNELIKTLKQQIRSRKADADSISLQIIDSIAGGLRFRESELIKADENYIRFSALLATYINFCQSKTAYTNEFLYDDTYLEIIERKLRILYYQLSAVNKDIIHSKFLQVLADAQAFLQKSTNMHQRNLESELEESVPEDDEEPEAL